MRDEELREHIRMLNALTSEWFPWQWTRARKQHEDLFGRLIQPGEYYLKRSNGAAWDAVIKLSQESMELLLYAPFSGNLMLEELANEFDRASAVGRDSTSVTETTVAILNHCRVKTVQRLLYQEPLFRKRNNKRRVTSSLSST